MKTTSTIKEVVDRAIKSSNGDIRKAFEMYVSTNRVELIKLGLLDKSADVLPEHQN